MTDLTAFEHVIVLQHPKIEATQPVAQEICTWICEQGIDGWLGMTWDEDKVRPRIADSNLVIVVGGDGSTLRAARMAAAHEVPVLGVNMGRLGFLSEVSPETWRERLPGILSGEYWIEQRMMLRARTIRKGQPISEHLALNDIVVSRGSLARVIRLHTEVDGDLLTTYTADGLIVATPTGSTAYALAAGGPVLPPMLRNMVVVPIAAHMSLNRAVVLAEGSLVQIHVVTDHQAILTVDGQFEFEMQDGDTVEVQTSDLVSRFVRSGERGYFYRSLLERLEPNSEDRSDPDID